MLSGKVLCMMVLLIICFVCGPSGFAQTCKGGSGELTISESFGTINQSSSLAGRTTYEYVSKPCPVDGEYTITDAVDGSCFSSFWHTVPEDHTPNDVRGTMMIVNGSYGSGEFYKQTISGLCSSAAYEFSVWGLNLLKPGICSNPLFPNLTIRIETESGQVIQTINIGSIAQTETPTWQRYSAMFTSPETQQKIILKLINNQGLGGCGNDLALDDIQLKQCSSCAATAAFVPDVFTPDNDGTNDVLAVFLREAVAFDLKIYNRWGNLIFTSNDLQNRWDGTYAGSPCSAGDYTWVVTYQPIQASSTPISYVQKGHVMLLR